MGDSGVPKNNSVLTDAFSRRFEYLRLSVTDSCNFRCSYCLPNGYRKQSGLPLKLTPDEIRRAVSAFSQLGLWKVRLTGGEPTLRSDFAEIVRQVAQVPGIRRVAMTTNGYRLEQNAQEWFDCGIRALNVSVDSLDPQRFRMITGHDRLAEVLRGVESARDAGIESIKLNVVLMRGINDDELDAMIDYVSERHISLRFIEVMRTNDNLPFFERRHLAGDVVVHALKSRGWRELPREAGAGPAVEFGADGIAGRVGIIAPYSNDFCSTCNRLRLSSDGKLHLCLFGDGGLPLRDLLQDDQQIELLTGRIRKLMNGKAASHRLHFGDSGATPHLASIGG